MPCHWWLAKDRGLWALPDLLNMYGRHRFAPVHVRSLASVVCALFVIHTLIFVENIFVCYFS